MKQSRNPETIHAPVGRYVHQIEVSGESRMLFLSGQVGKRPDGTVLADARATIEEFEERVGPVLSEAEREEDIDTLGGLVFSLAGRIPKRGEVVKHPSGLAFEIVDADSRRIKRLKVKNLPTPEAAE